MKLKNVLIVVNDMEKSKAFYKDLFGLEVVLDQDGNVILTEGLVLQDAAIWKGFIGKDIIPQNNATELYFEEADLEKFAEKLQNYKEPIQYVNPLMEHSWGQKVIRFYDPAAINDDGVIRIYYGTQYPFEEETDFFKNEELIRAEMEMFHKSREESCRLPEKTA